MSKELIITPSFPEYWERIYQSGDMGWDLNGPTPIFDHWIDAYDIALSICVLGAGNGWDAMRFAEKGHDVTAVDFAKSAIKKMKKTAKKKKIDINILQMDIFDLDKKYQEHFDVVLEYTCFCAIEPSRRREYINMVKCILKEHGELVGLLFPTDKDMDESGPPFAVPLQMTINLIKEYLTLVKCKQPSLSIASRSGRETFVIFRKDGN